ncbi:MAG: hypothetical protein HYU70_13170 [Bacteroidetes bacterium]|nr:hypothetical protein [Bacteroidota bacterium]
MAKQLSEMEQLEAFFKFEKLPKTIKLDSGKQHPFAGRGGFRGTEHGPVTEFGSGQSS